tara:strand:- start:97 stop:492 length:396 start_codon:yes stop_codon:yes gene_type:complete
MRTSKVLKGILIVLGIVLIGVGLSRLFDPIGFFQNSGITLDNQAGLLSEARATGGAVLGFGLLTLFGAFNHKLSYTSTISAIIVFLGFGVARLIGFVIDGYPGDGLLPGLIIEFVSGLIAVFALFKYRERS